MKRSGTFEAISKQINADHLGTPRAITRPSDNAVVWRWDNTDPFGANLPNEDPSAFGTTFKYNLRFPGQYYDQETSTHYNYFRDYDPATGRYVQSDPIGLDGGINTYLYVEADPLSSVDPDGLKPRKPRKPKMQYATCDDRTIIRCVEVCRAKGQIYQDCTQRYIKTPGVNPRGRYMGFECVCKDKEEQPVCGENCKKTLNTVRDAVTGAILVISVCVFAFVAS